MASEVWYRLRAWTGGLGRARRTASRSASSQRRATDHSGWLLGAGHLGVCNRTATNRPVATTATVAMAAKITLTRVPRIYLTLAGAWQRESRPCAPPPSHPSDGAGPKATGGGAGA